MTKEETISNIKAYLDGDTAVGNIIPLRSILESAIKYLSDPSLLSNLDEAAIDAAQLDMQDRQVMEATNDERLRYSRIFRRGFKAGAEWMAGQGEDGLVLFAYASGKAYIKTTYHGNGGDQVIVLVRKK